MIVAENLRRRLVDETNLVGAVDDQEAFAQMLHDVLRQLGHIREIQVFLANQGLALAHAACREAGGGGDDEQQDSEQSGGGVRVDVG